MWKKLLSMLLAVTMITSSVPFALAEGDMVIVYPGEATPTDLEQDPEESVQEVEEEPLPELSAEEKVPEEAEAFSARYMLLKRGAAIYEADSLKGECVRTGAEALVWAYDNNEGGNALHVAYAVDGDVHRGWVSVKDAADIESEPEETAVRWQGHALPNIQLEQASEPEQDTERLPEQDAEAEQEMGSGETAAPVKRPHASHPEHPATETDLQDAPDIQPATETDLQPVPEESQPATLTDLQGEEQEEPVTLTDLDENADSEWDHPVATLTSGGSGEIPDATPVSSSYLNRVLQMQETVGGWFMFEAPVDGDYQFSVMLTDVGNISGGFFEMWFYLNGKDRTKVLGRFEDSSVNTIKTVTYEGIKKGDKLYWWDSKNGTSLTFTGTYKLKITCKPRDPWVLPAATFTSAGNTDASRACVIPAAYLDSVLQMQETVGGWFVFEAPQDGDYQFTVMLTDVGNISGGYFQMWFYLNQGSRSKVLGNFEASAINTKKVATYKGIKKGDKLYWWDSKNGTGTNFTGAYKLQISCSDTSIYCGENVTWSLKNGIMTIEGKGDMWDYSTTPAPWTGKDVREITIREGVTSVGAGAFKSLKNLTSVYMADSVTTIGASAFRDAGKGMSVTWSDGIRSSGAQAFYGADVSSVQVDSLSAWCSVSFSGSTSNPLYKGENAAKRMIGFWVKNEQVTQIVVPDSITDIKPYAFYGCKQLTSVQFHKGVLSVGTDAFRNTPAVKDLWFEGKESDWSESFLRVSGLYGRMNEIRCHYYELDFSQAHFVFSNRIYSNQYESMYFAPEEATLGGINLREGEDYTLSYSNPDETGVGLIEVTITGIGKYTGTLTAEYYVFINQVHAEWADPNAIYLTYTGAEQYPELRLIDQMGDVLTPADYSLWPVYGGDLSSPGQHEVRVDIFGFYNCNDTLTYYINRIPMNVQVEDLEYYFTGDPIWPEYTVTWGEGFECEDHYDVTFGGMSRYEGGPAEPGVYEMAFHSTNMLYDWEEMLYYFPGEEMGGQYPSYMYTVLPRTEPIAFGDGLVWQLRDVAADEYGKLSATLVISGIGDFPDFTSASQQPWERFSEIINRVEIIGSVTGVGDYAFAELDHLKSASLGVNVSYVGVNAFRNSGLTEIELPENTGVILAGAFANTPLTSVSLYPTLTEIEDGAFSGCRSLRQVIFHGTEDEWENILIGSDNDALLNAVLEANGSDLLSDMLYDQYGDPIYRQFPSSEYDVVSGVEWRLTRNGVLTIGCDGDMPFAYTTQPWYIYVDYVTSVVVLNGVTSLSGGMFAGMGKVTSVQLPTTLRTIQANAFSGATALTELTLPAGVSSVGANAFADCGVRTVNVPSPEALLGISFADASANPVSSGARILVNGSTFSSVTIPATMTVVGSYSMLGQTSLTSVKIEKRTKPLAVGAHAFDGCRGVREVSVQGMDSLASWLMLDLADFEASPVHGGAILRLDGGSPRVLGLTAAQLKPWAFAGVTTLETLILEDDINAIPQGMFKGCTGLKYVTWNGSRAKWEKVVTASDNEPLTALTPVFTCIAEGTIGSRLEWVLKNNGELHISGYGSAEVRYTKGGAPWYPYRKEIKRLAFEGRVESIPDYAFYGCDQLVELIIPDSLLTMGKGAFMGCTGLKHVDVGYGGGFYEAEAFADTAVERVDCDALQGWTGILFYDEKSNPMWADTADLYIGGSKLTSADLSAEHLIFSFTFLNCHDLVSVVMSDKMMTINGRSFHGCTGLEEVIWHGRKACWKSLLACENDRFLAGGNEPLKAEGLKVTWDTIDAGTLETGHVWEINGSGIMTIYGVGDMPEAFAKGAPWKTSMEEIVSVIFADRVTSITANAFDGAVNLERVVLSEEITGIGAGAFRGAIRLGAIELPFSVTAVGAEAFSGCTGLTTAVYDGLLEDWQQVTVGSGNDPLLAVLKWQQVEIDTRPTDLTISYSGEKNVTTLRWMRIRGAEHYVITRKTHDGVKSWIDERTFETRDIVFYDETVSPGQVYAYSVRGVGKTEGPESKMEYHRAEDARVSITSIGQKGTSYVVNWEKPSEDKPAGYALYRITHDGDFAELKTNITANTFTDSKAVYGVTYGYYVIPYYIRLVGKTKIVVWSAASDEAWTTIQPPKAPVLTVTGPSTMRADWVSLEGAVNYKLEVYQTKVLPANLVATCDNITESSYELANLIAGMTYCVRVVAVDANGYEAIGAAASKKQAFTLGKAAISAVLATDFGEAEISWRPVPGADRYTVTAVSGKLPPVIKEGLTETVCKLDLTPGLTWSITVTAFNEETGKSTVSAKKSWKQPVLTAPKTVAVSLAEYGYVTVAWTASPMADHYQVWFTIGDERYNAAELQRDNPWFDSRYTTWPTELSVRLRMKPAAAGMKFLPEVHAWVEGEPNPAVAKAKKAVALTLTLGTPGNLKVSRQLDQVTVSFNSVEGAQDYLVEVDGTEIYSTEGKTTFTFEWPGDLPTGTIRVSAWNYDFEAESGKYAAAKSTKAITLGSIASAPVLVNQTADDEQGEGLTSKGMHTAKVTWKPAANATGYIIAWYTDKGVELGRDEVEGGENCSFTIPTTPNTKVYVTVTPVCSLLNKVGAAKKSKILTVK